MRSVYLPCTTRLRCPQRRTRRGFLTRRAVQERCRRPHVSIPPAEYSPLRLGAPATGASDPASVWPSARPFRRPTTGRRSGARSPASPPPVAAAAHDRRRAAPPSGPFCSGGIAIRPSCGACVCMLEARAPSAPGLKRSSDSGSTTSPEFQAKRTTRPRTSPPPPGAPTTYRGDLCAHTSAQLCRSRTLVDRAPRTHVRRARSRIASPTRSDLSRVEDRPGGR
jgi:hypothetical protein